MPSFKRYHSAGHRAAPHLCPRIVWDIEELNNADQELSPMFRFTIRDVLWLTVVVALYLTY
jgi:hypothetical protein